MSKFRKTITFGYDYKKSLFTFGQIEKENRTIRECSQRKPRVWLCFSNCIEIKRPFFELKPNVMVLLSL